MDVFSVIAQLIDGIITAMKQADFLYGISFWHLFLLFNVFIDLELIVKAIFSKKKGVE